MEDLEIGVDHQKHGLDTILQSMIINLKEIVEEKFLDA
jgi:hypothetical protein